MFKNCLLICSIFLCSCCYAQQLSQITFSQATDFVWFSLLTNQHILIRLASDGRILEYGTEQSAINNPNYFAPNLIAYNGTISYYQHEADSGLNGKIKNIGDCYFTYYSSKDYPERAGKLKSAGNLSFDYFRYEDPLNKGKLKSIGNNVISYYGLNDNEAFKGKLKNVGNTTIVYYSSFENPQLKGKLKSIGNYIFDWGATSNGREFISYLKNGYGRKLINGIVYIPQ